MQKFVLLLLFLILFFLFAPLTYLHGDAPGYELVTQFYLGRFELKDTVMGLGRVNRPLLPWLSVIPYSIVSSKFVLLAIVCMASFFSLLLLEEFGGFLGLNKQECFYSVFALLFSKYYFNYGFTLFPYTLGLFFLLLMWNWGLKNESPIKVGFSGLLSMLAIPTSITGIFVPAIYYGVGEKDKIVKYLGYFLILVLAFQLYNTMNYGHNYIFDANWVRTEYSPGWDWNGFLFGRVDGFSYGLIPSILGVLHIPLTLCMLIGLRGVASKKLQEGFWLTFGLSIGLILFWKEDGLRMFLSWLPFASLYAGKGIGIIVGWFGEKKKWAEGLVLGTIAVSSVLLSAKWVWIFV